MLDTKQYLASSAIDGRSKVDGLAPSTVTAWFVKSFDYIHDFF